MTESDDKAALEYLGNGKDIMPRIIRLRRKDVGWSVARIVAQHNGEGVTVETLHRTYDGALENYRRCRIGLPWWDCVGLAIAFAGEYEARLHEQIETVRRFNETWEAAGLP